MKKLSFDNYLFSIIEKWFDENFVIAFHDEIYRMYHKDSKKKTLFDYKREAMWRKRVHYKNKSTSNKKENESKFIGNKSKKNKTKADKIRNRNSYLKTKDALQKYKSMRRQWQ